MIIKVNDQVTEHNFAQETYGDILTFLDEKAEKAGQIIVAITLNGQSVGADHVVSLAANPCQPDDGLEIRTQPIRFMRVDAISILLGLTDAMRSNPDAERVAALKADTVEFRNRYSGLFSAEENSFIDSLLETLRSVPEENLATCHDKLEQVRLFFSERLAEAEDPRLAMVKTTALFQSLFDDLGTVSVRLQTGKDRAAMHTMVVIVELINKTVRILPDFIAVLPDSRDLRIDNQTIQEFYDNFNGVLRELMTAFEHKDSVLIGDLAEYEIRPRMAVFFKAIDALIGQEQAC
ncbi:MAG: hypothetical protein A2087_10405 [Spirochaetes bacterium GWD1_61_31]|nr:MAG: hypothetical protein A2Y37_12110 [Spirochaetes bacterium GWB1_60_80]OHD30122.1 MAG: hypothetical protein A2004_13970 [Spirochaetes bacterium GWC1_61_12]OHD34625.1 MAG: hypothetical protein A2087_10405 [Spirochaetes bacterium GWD1_61_31]OHD46441.1 MAG: hypothetical protein A2Y35_10310 [Spirochaetes bacterium GWE1_60_18]OHD59496.1 MAG: hypothetical protein A2Y32_10265 [Spirochaetes bacterium GWF1_60_12]HAW85808.1 hypothetical protein [Spirochaetaceae bacterium]